MPATPHPVDVYVGTRLQLLRLERGLSQQKLGNALGLSFQQVQKYEKGKNRISSSMLFEISEILKVPIAYFFDGLSIKTTSPQEIESGNEISSLVATRDGLRMVKAFSKISNRKIGQSIINLVEDIASPDS